MDQPAPYADQQRRHNRPRPGRPTPRYGEAGGLTMLRSVLLLFTATLVGFLAGCGQGADPDQPNPDAAPGRIVIPDPGDVSAVVIGVHGGPGNESRFPGAPFELRLADRADMAEVLGWLKQVDWSREGMDLTAVRLALA